MFDFTKTIARIKKSFKDDKRRADEFGLGDNLGDMSNDPKDYVVLPDWWKEYFGVMGLQVGHWTQISGFADAGKTSLCVLAMKAAQAQGFGVIYAETEKKTQMQELEQAGISLKGLLLVKTNITENLFDDINLTVEEFYEDYPKEKLLIVIDSYGNTTSIRDAELKMVEKTAMVGGAAKSNRMGIQSFIAKQNKHDIAVLIVNYAYSNIGSHGQTNAGGQALELACSLIISARRKGNYLRTIKGVKVRAGIFTTYSTTKNHYAKTLRDKENKPILLPKELVLRISSGGMEPQKKE